MHQPPLIISNNTNDKLLRIIKAPKVTVNSRYGNIGSVNMKTNSDYVILNAILTSIYAEERISTLRLRMLF